MQKCAQMIFIWCRWISIFSLEIKSSHVYIITSGFWQRDVCTESLIKKLTRCYSQSFLCSVHFNIPSLLDSKHAFSKFSFWFLLVGQEWAPRQCIVLFLFFLHTFNNSLMIYFFWESHYFFFFCHLRNEVVEVWKS